jgi:hypothetical protein
MDLSVHYALGSDPFDPHDIPGGGGVSPRCSTVSDRKVFWLPATQVRGATRSTWLWAGHYPEKRKFYIGRLASLVEFECRELDPSTVKRAVRWQQGPAFVAHLVAPQKDGKTFDIAGDYIAAFWWSRVLDASQPATTSASDAASEGCERADRFNHRLPRCGIGRACRSLEIATNGPRPEAHPEAQPAVALRIGQGFAARQSL